MKYIYQIISIIAVSSKFTDVSAECADIFDVCTFLFDATSCRYQPRCSWNGRSCVALDCFVHKNKDSCEDDFGCYWVGDDESEDSSDWNGHNENNWPSDVGHGSGSPGSGPPGYGPGTSLWTAEKEAQGGTMKTAVRAWKGLPCWICRIEPVLHHKQKKGAPPCGSTPKSKPPSGLPGNRGTSACSHSICEMRCPQKAWWQGARQGWWWCHQP